MNLPNKLTLLRIILIPVFILCFYLPIPQPYHLAALIFVVAYITDILDGRIARKQGIVTDFGKLADPVADKMLTSSALIMLTAFGIISPIPAIIIIAREFIVTGFRLVTAGKGTVIAANIWGKMKTVSQCVAIVLLLFHDELLSLLGFPLDLVVLWLSVALAVWSGFEYLWKNRGLLQKQA